MLSLDDNTGVVLVTLIFTLGGCACYIAWRLTGGKHYRERNHK